jgi:diguanylate cyclase (GGDEF)-like protein
VPNCTLVALPFVAFLMSVLRHLHQLQTDYARLAREFDEALATTDLLTGLPNCRAFMDRLDQARGSGQPGALLLDADHFKRINDTWGH